MTASESDRVSLIDQADGPGRTTATLVASLAARLAVLHFATGADAVGSLVAGFAVLGREVGRTAEGNRLRQAIAAGRPGQNGQALWKALRISEWASPISPSPLLDQLRNDLALLLAEDLEATLEVMPIPGQTVGVSRAANTEPVSFIDCLLGLWAFSRELVRAVEVLAAPTIIPPGAISNADQQTPEPEGQLLR
jgi:hypothetical protein